MRIAPSIAESDTRIIDVGGQMITPGFIDIHSHAREGIFNVPAAENYIRQGVTTVIEGPDGSSPLPIAEFLARLDALQKDFSLDVKKLTTKTHEYRLRMGSLRVLFTLERDLISVYAVKDRKTAYE